MSENDIIDFNFIDYDLPFGANDEEIFETSKPELKKLSRYKYINMKEKLSPEKYEIYLEKKKEREKKRRSLLPITKTPEQLQEMRRKQSIRQKRYKEKIKSQGNFKSKGKFISLKKDLEKIVKNNEIFAQESKKLVEKIKEDNNRYNQILKDLNEKMENDNKLLDYINLNMNGGRKKTRKIKS